MIVRNDTIAAIATAIGESAVAVVRVSGPVAVEIAAPLIRSRRALQVMDSHRLTRVTLLDPRNGDPIDEALCAVMRAPRSYTGEDTVEIFCHGSPALARMLVERLVDQGARLADPGEFTRRAFINGRLDLAQAEAVALLISARTEQAVTLAARAVRGDLSKRIEALRARLLGAIASLEVALDFPDDVQAPDGDTIHHEIRCLQKETARLLSSTRRGLVNHTGLTVAIVGAPNAGKSSLFNALLGRERAIVTPEAGTTRDVIEGTIVVGGVPVRLQDTAGMGLPRDAVDAEGMRRTGLAIEESDLLVLVVDGTQPDPGVLVDVVRSKPHVVVLSKSDLGFEPDAPIPPNSLRVSVVTAEGLSSLMDRLGAEVAERAGRGREDAAVAASIRQVGLLESLSDCVGRAGEALTQHPVEIALIELRSALDAACALLGVEVGDAVLDAIFARFCVGK